MSATAVVVCILSVMAVLVITSLLVARHRAHHPQPRRPRTHWGSGFGGGGYGSGGSCSAGGGCGGGGCGGGGGS